MTNDKMKAIMIAKGIIIKLRKAGRHVEAAKFEAALKKDLERLKNGT